MFSLNDMNVLIVGNKTFAATLNNVSEGLCYGADLVIGKNVTKVKK